MSILCILPASYMKTAFFEMSALLTIGFTNLILGLSPFFYALVSSSCFWSCLSSSDLVVCLSKGRESATADAAATNSGLIDSLLKKKMKKTNEKEKRSMYYLLCH